MNQDYFIYTYDLDDDIPLIAWEGSSREFNKPRLVTTDKFELRVGEPKPNSIAIVDSYWAGRPLVSEKVAAVFSDNLPIEQAQPVKAIIKDIDLDSSYYLIHFPVRMTSYDKEKSNVVYDEYGEVQSVNNIYLEEDFLNNTPVEDRLAFRLSTDFVHFVVHKSIKEKIEQVKPTGVRFIALEDWNITSPFDG